MRKEIIGVMTLLICSYSVGACPEYEVADTCKEEWTEYDSAGGVEMAHWANLRDCAGNLIGTVSAGAEVEIIGQCEDDPSRTLVYDYSTGTYGTVSSVYIYGGTCYEYENPTEYSYTEYSSCKYDEYNPDYIPYEITYDSCYDYYSPDEYEYEEESLTPALYDETTPWACDNLAYEEYVWEEEADSYDDDYFVFYGNDEIWVDVDINAQVVNIYQGNKIISSGPCVTGMSGVSDTPCGTYYIGDKTQNAVLCGQDYDGSSYECPVDYWMQFSGGCGFHDASWRENFGGDIYEYGGSHGCVNLEHDFAQEMYEIVPDGAQVVVHGNG